MSATKKDANYKFFLDALYSDDAEFVRYVRAHDCAELRKLILRTNRLKLLYCYHVCRRRSAYHRIPGTPEMLRNSEFQAVRRSIKYGRKGFIHDILAEGGRTTSTISIPVILD